MRAAADAARQETKHVEASVKVRAVAEEGPLCLTRR